MVNIGHRPQASPACTDIFAKGYVKIENPTMTSMTDTCVETIITSDRQHMSISDYVKALE